MLSMDRRRAFGGWFCVATLAYIALYFNDVSYIFMDSSGDALATFAMSGAMGMVTYMMPFFAALPYAAGFCQDWNSGFAGPAALRAGNRRYLASKFAGCALSGGLAPALGTLAFILMLVLKFSQSDGVLENQAASDPFARILLTPTPWGLALYYGGKVLLQFFAGACWATTGLAFSAFCPNLLLTLCVPLAAYRVSLELYYWFAPPLWLNLPLLQDGAVGLEYGATLLTGLGVFGGLTLLLGAAFALRAGRRLTYG